MPRFYLRAVCMNRNLWGVENFEEITIRHSKFAAQRFAHEAAPALDELSPIPRPRRSSPGSRPRGSGSLPVATRTARAFCASAGFSKSETAKIIETVLSEENRKPESIFDFVQGITALARSKTHQDTRLELEGKARKLLERAA